MNRAACFTAILVVLTLGSAGPAGAQQADPAPSRPTDKPNILLIMLDDFGYNDLAINNGNTAINTPNMDAFARQGMRFTRHYASPVCNPARAALLTGLYPERVGFLPSGRGISPQIITLPERLREAGYTTWHLGKWHLGEHQRGSWPDRQGFDHWFGFLNQAFLGGAARAGTLQAKKPRYENPWLMGDAEPGAIYPGHLTDILADRAIATLSDLHERQAHWFLNLWFYAPHAPLQPAARFAASYPDTPAGRYRALVHQLDHNVGRVLDHLQTLGIADQTLVVIVSDNGGTNRELDSNAPYAGKKMLLTEGGLRTPLLIRWPDDALNGRVFDGLVGIADLYPTLLAAVGAPVPAGLDSESFYASVRRHEAPPARARFWEMPGTNAWSVLSADGRWRLRQPYDPWRSGRPPELYDLHADPSGARPVEPLPQERYRRMLADYLAWHRDVHTVDTTYVEDVSGTGSLTGSDFLRIPGNGTYTLGLGVPDDFAGPLVRQEDTWSLVREGNHVTARFGGQILLRGLLQRGRGCHAVVLSGDFHRKRSGFAQLDEIDVALYIEGIEVAAARAPGTLLVADPGLPTVIGNAGESGVRPGPPVILNTRLDSTSPWTVEDFSTTLCAGGGT